MQRKALSGKQATATRSMASVRVAPANAKPVVLAPTRVAFTPAVAFPAASRKVVATRAATEAPSAPSNTVQEKTTNPMNLVFVATEVSKWRGIWL